MKITKYEGIHMMAGKPIIRTDDSTWKHACSIFEKMIDLLHEGESALAHNPEWLSRIHAYSFRPKTISGNIFSADEMMGIGVMCRWWEQQIWDTPLMDYSSVLDGKYHKLFPKFHKSEKIIAPQSYGEAILFEAADIDIYLDPWQLNTSEPDEAVVACSSQVVDPFYRVLISECKLFMDFSGLIEARFISGACTLLKAANECPLCAIYEACDKFASSLDGDFDLTLKDFIANATDDVDCQLLLAVYYFALVSRKDRRSAVVKRYFSDSTKECFSSLLADIDKLQMYLTENTRDLSVFTSFEECIKVLRSDYLLDMPDSEVEGLGEKIDKIIAKPRHPLREPIQKPETVSEKRKSNAGAPKQKWYPDQYEEVVVQSKFSANVWNSLKLYLDELDYYNSTKNGLSKAKKGSKSFETAKRNLGTAIMLLAAKQIGFTDVDMSECSAPMARTFDFANVSRGTVSQYLKVMNEYFLKLFSRLVVALKEDDKQRIQNKQPSNESKLYLTNLVENYSKVVVLFINAQYYINICFDLKATTKLLDWDTIFGTDRILKNAKHYDDKKAAEEETEEE